MSQVDPSSNGAPRQPHHPATRSSPTSIEYQESPPSTWMLSLALFMPLCLGFAFMEVTNIVCCIPPVLALLWWAERPLRWKHTVVGVALSFGFTIGFAFRWLAPTVQDFGGLSAPAAWGTTVLFGLASTVHLLLFAAIYRGMILSRRSRGRPRPHPLATASLLVVCETLPLKLFPWWFGVCAIDCPPLAQVAAWGGVPGVSFIFLCLVVPLYEWMHGLFEPDLPRDGTAHPGISRTRPVAALCTFLVGVAAVAFGHWDGVRIDAQERAATRHLRVGIVQANIGSFNKRQAEQERVSSRALALAAYRRGTERVRQEDVDLIVWPETAIARPIPFATQKATSNVIPSVLRKHNYGFLVEAGKNHGLLVGAYEEIRRRRARVAILGKRTPDRRYNCAALRQRGVHEAPWSVYRKHHLIPFGETMPLGLPKSMLPQSFVMESGDVDQPPLEFEGHKLVPLLCYEGILPDFVSGRCATKRPDVFVSLANDSWFGNTWEPFQHLNLTRFRAIEHRTPMIRSTNTGISAFVGATGEVHASLGIGKDGVLVRSVPIVDRAPTLFARFGHLILWVFIALWVFGLLGLYPGDRH